MNQITIDIWKEIGILVRLREAKSEQYDNYIEECNRDEESAILFKNL